MTLLTLSQTESLINWQCFILQETRLKQDLPILWVKPDITGRLQFIAVNSTQKVPSDSLYMEKRKYKSDKAKNEAVQSGILFTSGMIAGEGIVGILLAVLAVITVGDESVGDIINISDTISLGNIGGLVAFGLLLATIVLFCAKGAKSVKE